MSIIILLSDLCLNRNKEAIEWLEERYEFECIYEIINNGPEVLHEDEERIDYGLTVRHAFTRLMITLWIDRTENVKIILPNRIRIWNKLENA